MQGSLGILFCITTIPGPVLMTFSYYLELCPCGREKERLVNLTLALYSTKSNYYIFTYISVAKEVNWPLITSRVQRA